jgi:amidohydrolase
MPTGMIGYRPGPFMAGRDIFRLVVTGRQTHGARPWQGVDPIVVSAQIINGLQTIVSRQLDITDVPAVVTIGAIRGGIRHNIIPDSVEMLGTLRTYRPEIREDVIQRVRSTAEGIAAASGASVEFTLGDTPYPSVLNDPGLTQRMRPALERAAPGKVRPIGLLTSSEDFAFYASRVPGLFISIGVNPPGRSVAEAASVHSPLFFLDEAALTVGLRAMLEMATDYLAHGAAGRP